MERQLHAISMAGLGAASPTAQGRSATDDDQTARFQNRQSQTGQERAYKDGSELSRYRPFND
jgi:hypothetical protein